VRQDVKEAEINKSQAIHVYTTRVLGNPPPAVGTSVRDGIYMEYGISRRLVVEYYMYCSEQW